MSYKIIRGYSAEDYIEINDTELEKAYYCFLEKKDSIFSGGAIKGSQILAIQPDFHKVMGWNRGYKLEVDDFADISQKGVDRKLQNRLAEAKQKVGYLIATKQTHLIGQNFEIPKIENAVGAEIKQLADKMKI